MRNGLLALTIIFSILIGCSKDEEKSQISTGTLIVNVKSSDGVAEPNAAVLLVEESSTLITDSSGSVRFTNIASGFYTIEVNVSETSLNYTPGLVYKIENVEVSQDQTNTVDLALIEGPKPIEEADLDIDVLLNDTYKKLKGGYMFDVGGYSLYWGDIGSDIAYVGNSSTSPVLLALDTYDFQPSNTIINKVWEENYKAIRNTNIGLEAIASGEYVTKSGKSENLINAELRFLRAIYYFNLLKLYGNPFLVTSTAIDQTLNQDREGVKKLIEEDLMFAESNLSDFTSAETPSKAATQALLGRFYLQCAGYPDNETDKYLMAAQQLEKVMNTFSLEEKYSSVFSASNENGNTELIFSIGFDSSIENQGGNHGVHWGPVGYALQDDLRLDSKFIQNYFTDENDFQNPVTFPLNIDDERFFVNIAPFAVEDGTTIEATDPDNWRPTKYISDFSSGPEPNGSSVDFPFLRYADVLLMLAEVENNLNGPTTKAYDLVNEVISRSNSSTTAMLSGGLSQDEFLQELLKQRRMELCFEGLYKDDLIRNNLLEEVILDFNQRNPNNIKQFETYKSIWPIPISEINLNPNAVQNPGY